jgi:hypothetical protein
MASTSRLLLGLSAPSGSISRRSLPPQTRLRSCSPSRPSSMSCPKRQPSFADASGRLMAFRQRCCGASALNLASVVYPAGTKECMYYPGVHTTRDGWPRRPGGSSIRAAFASSCPLATFTKRKESPDFGSLSVLVMGPQDACDVETTRRAPATKHLVLS